jgi:phosphatidylglycerophosphate synthase
MVVQASRLHDGVQARGPHPKTRPSSFCPGPKYSVSEVKALLPHSSLLIPPLPFVCAIGTVACTEEHNYYYRQTRSYCTRYLMQAVLFKSPEQDWWWLGGMTLLERNLRQLEAVGVKTVLILHPTGETLPRLATSRPLHLETFGGEVSVSMADPLTVLPFLHLEASQPLFLLDANLLLDQRILETLRHQSPPCFVAMGNGKDPSPLWRVGWLRPEDLPLGPALLQQAGRVSLAAVPLYDAELRGEAVPYCEKIRTEEDLDRGWHLLLDWGSQRSRHVIEKLINLPIENWLVRQWCHTLITPDQVTLLTVAVALVGASLFYQGWVLLAVLFAWITTVLDGVDGKLARVKLLTSRLGKFDHMVALFYENAWYLAAAADLSRTHGPSAWNTGLSITAFVVCDTLLRTMFTQLKEKSLDNMSRFDRYFHLIGGHRSLYLLIFLVGFLFDAPLVALQVVLYWAGTTVLIHVGRAAYHLLRD